MEYTNVPQYEQYFALSIKGHSHYESGKPMQDYSKAARTDDHCISIVCDGHGSDKHFRSDVGSRLATEVTFGLLSQWAQTYPTWESFNVDVPEKLERLKLAIMTGWQRATEAYTAENPFTEAELAIKSSSFQNRKTFDIGTPYGTTLLAALMCQDYYLVIMLGDGAIMKIKPGEGDNPAATAKGVMVDFPGKKIYDDSPHSATDSMCSPESYNSIFFSYGQIDEEEDYGLLFALGSDGISEAFTRDESLVKEFMLHFGNYLQVGMEQALQDSENRLNRLSQASAAHDDISIAYATLNEEAYACVVEEIVEEEAPEEETQAEDDEILPKDEMDDEQATGETVTITATEETCPIVNVTPDDASLQAPQDVQAEDSDNADTIHENAEEVTTDTTMAENADDSVSESDSDSDSDDLDDTTPPPSVIMPEMTDADE